MVGILDHPNKTKMITATFVGYVTSKGVQANAIKGYDTYRVTLKDSIRQGKDKSRLALYTCTFWGKNFSYLEKYVAPYDQMTIVGEIRNVRVGAPEKEGDSEILYFDIDAKYAALPRREDSDGANKSRIQAQRRETLKPDPAKEADEEIPF
jgi:single-stranded DNA-binding protein